MVVNNGMDYMNDDPERGMMAKQHSVDEPLDQKIVLQKNTHATTHWLFHCYYEISTVLVRSMDRTPPSYNHNLVHCYDPSWV